MKLKTIKPKPQQELKVAKTQSNPRFIFLLPFTTAHFTTAFLLNRIGLLALMGT
ncbi:hypothetical protein HNW13_020105 [Shewanella sp. BF02_Schw]|uniref:hypothetical protein n=1 Tax=Shewanella sp. BF02_Schw TaxID=394908 RepID=UPI001AA1BA05|nr:hypothetical protein [Shewanella sp. BF02_Schw]MBO1898048.1 hypothetical protein [Shewanella sp. BF02_Schw]